MLAFFRNFLQFAILLGFWAAAYGWGSLIVRLVSMPRVTGPNDRHPWSLAKTTIVSIAIGWGILGHLTLLLGALGLLYRRYAILVLALGVILALVDLYRRVRAAGGFRALLQSLPRPDLRAAGFFGLLLGLGVLLGWIYPLFADALAPPLAWDEVAYHLAIPRLFIRSHALTYIPFIPYSNWPMETEMLYTLEMLLESKWVPVEQLPHLVTWSALLLTSASLFYYGRRFFGLQAGLLAAALFGATPMVLNLAGEGLIELPLTMFVALSTLALIDWIRSGERRSWILSAIFGGLAASTKLNAALIPLILGLFMAGYRHFARKEAFLRGTLLHFSIYGLIAFIIVLPWYLKAWVFTGNPFWPFFFEILGGKNWDALGSEYLFGFIRAPNLPLTPLNWVLGLWEMAKNPEKFGPVGIRTGWLYLGLLPVGLAGLFLVKGRQKKLLGWLAFTGLVYYTAWFFQTHQARFFMPAAAVWAVFLAGGVSQIWQWANQRWPSAGRIAVQAGLALALLAAQWPLSAESRQAFTAHWDYIRGQESGREHLVKLFPGYAVYDYANKNLPRQAVVWLALYESRGYYLNRAYLWANPISQRVLPLEQLASPEELAAELHNRGITHLIFRRTGLDRYTYIRYGDRITRLALGLLEQHAQLLYSAGDLELYALLPPDEALP